MNDRLSEIANLAPGRGCLRTRRMLAAAAVADLGPDKYQMEMRKLERAATNIDTPDLEQQVQQLNAWFAQHARKELWGTLSLGAGSFSVGAALLVGAVYAPTLAAELAVGFVGYTMSKVFDAITDASIDEMNQQAESTLAAMLGRVEEVAAKEFGAALALPAAQRAAELARLTRSLDGITFPDDARTQNLADLHRRLLEEGFERRLHDVNIQASLDAAVARTNAVREMLIAQGEQIAQMQQDVAGLTESVQRLAENSARLERRFDAMARLIYPRLSPKEQQYALDNRLLGDLPLEEENGLRDEIARVKALQAFTKTSGEILSGAGLVAQFGDRLGIDPQLVGFAAEVNRVGTGVLTAILALPTDPLGFAGALLGTIFGVTDAAQLRHEQTMRALNQVLDGIQRLSKQVDELRRTIEIRFVEVARQLEQVRKDVLINRSYLADLVGTPVAAANTFLSRRESYLRMRGGAPTASLALHFADYHGMFDHAWDEIERMLGIESINSYFLAATEVAPASSEAVDKFCEDCHALMEWYMQRCRCRVDALVAYLSSIPREAGLFEELVSTSDDRSPTHLARQTFSVLPRALALSHVLAVGRFFLETHYYHQLRVPGQSTLSFEPSILGMVLQSQRGAEGLRAFSDLLRATICQRVMASGAGVVNAIQAIFSQTAHSSFASLAPDVREQRVRAQRILRQSAIVRYNFGVHVVGAMLARGDENMYSYEVSLRWPYMVRIYASLCRPLGLEVSLRTHVRHLTARTPQCAETQICLVVPALGNENDSITIPFPDPQRANARHLFYDEDVLQLAALRTRVVSTIGEYAITADTAPGELYRHVSNLALQMPSVPGA